MKPARSGRRRMVRRLRDGVRAPHGRETT
jgi:hypothetical protein